MITVQFKDLEDMMIFARQLAGMPLPQAVTDAPSGTQPAPTPAAPSAPKEDTAATGRKEEIAAKGAPEEPPSVSLEEVRAKLAALNKAGKRAEVKALLAEFGAVKLSEVPEDQYATLMEKAGEL